MHKNAIIRISRSVCGTSIKYVSVLCGMDFERGNLGT